MDWRLIPEAIHDGPVTMALDEVAAETVTKGGPATVRVYRWLPSTLSLGYGQDPATVDWEFCADWNVSVTRRPTGGGAIYHDTAGDVAYSIVAPADAFPSDVTACYRELLEPVLAAFDAVDLAVDFADEPREAIYEPACYLRAVDPAHDLVAPDGRKIAGNAQYRTRDAVVQHGSLTYDVNAEKHLGCFADPPDEDVFREHVAGMTEFLELDHEVETGFGTMSEYDLRRSRFVAELEDALADWADADDGEWTAAERERAQAIADAKYRNDAWIHDREDSLD